MRRVLVFAVLAVAFGVVDATLWSNSSNEAEFWVGNMSSLWLLLPFLAGRWSRTQSGAVFVGLLVTLAALASFYVWRTAHFQQASVLSMMFAKKYVAGGMVTGPIFGWLGRRWGSHRSWYSAVALVAAFALEPLAWARHLGYLPWPHIVWTGERIAAGVLGCWFLVQSLRTHLPRRSVSG